MSEETTLVEETTPKVTTEGSQDYMGAVLEGDGTTPQDSPAVEPKEVQTQEDNAEPVEGEPKPEGEGSATEIDPEQELSIQIGDKTFTGKYKHIQKFFDLLPSFEGNEETLLNSFTEASKLSELKKNYDKGFTQKTQEVSDFWKSVETSFGRRPDPQELVSMGKLYQAYFQDQDAKAVIDAIVSGQSVRSVFDANAQVNPRAQGFDPNVQALVQKIDVLQNQINSLNSGINQREQAKIHEEASRNYNNWVASKEKQGLKITNEIDKAMAPFITALSQSYPDWDDVKILDKAYEHATIGQTRQKVTASVLTDAEKARKGSPPKITPKTATVPDEKKSYGSMFLER